MGQNRGPDGREAEPIMGNNGSKMAILTIFRFWSKGYIYSRLRSIYGVDFGWI